MNTILVILGLLFMLAGVLFIFYQFLLRSASQRATLKAIVTIEPEGDTRIEWTPNINSNEIGKMKLAVQYLAKIGFVLDKENEEVKEMFYQLLNSLVSSGEHQHDDYFFNQLDHISSVIEASNSESFYPTADTFIVELVEGVSGDYVVNALPIRGLAVNIPVSVFALLNEVASSLTAPGNRMFFRSIIQKVIIEMNNIKNFGVSDLKFLAQSTSRSFRELSGVLT